MTEPAPKIIDGAETVAYSPIDLRHRPTHGCRHTANGVPIGPAAGLAICQYKGEKSFYLFSCRDDWRSITDTWHKTLDDAMAQAEFEYEGVTKTWANHSPAWSPLSDADASAAWDLFYEQLQFRPSVQASDWPGIAEPIPSVTYDISWAFGDESAFISLTTDLNLQVLQAIRRCVLPGQEVFALDWQHPCYRLNPYGVFDASDSSKWAVTPFPDGDYQIILATDFSFGLFGHPWEQTICMFGAKLIDALAHETPRLFSRMVRCDGKAT